MPQEPRRFDRIWQRLLAFLRPQAIDRDLQDELATHLELAADDYASRGMSRDEARRLAALQFGSRAAARELHRDTRGLPTLDSVLKDLGYAVRGFRREPAFTLIAVAMLALGIGANTAVFSVVEPLLLRPLPFSEPDRLMWISKPSQDEGSAGRAYRVAVVEEIAKNTRVFSDVASYFVPFGFMQFTLTGSGTPERLAGVPIGPRFFELLGVRPLAGRLFTAEELAPKGPNVAILSYRLWQRRFASDPAIVGRSLTINDQPITVVGILPPDFDFASTFTPGVRVDFFVPAVFDDMREWGNVLALVGRLKPGVTPELARAETIDLIARLKPLHPEWRGFADVVAEPILLQDYVAGPMRRSLAVLWAAVGLVLLIVCANLSNLLLARTAARSKEIALRMALGAGRARVLRQLLTEGLLLSLCGATLGVPLAYALTAWLRDRGGLNVPLLYHVHVDGSALLFTAALAILAGLTCGTIPALKVSNRDLHATLKEQHRGSTDGRRHAWLRSALVVVEVALACVLLIGAGLLVRSLAHLMQLNLGFEPSRAFALHIDTPTGLTTAQRNARLDEMVRRVRTTPGVESAGLTDALPLDRNRSWGIALPHASDSYDKADFIVAFVYLTGPGYLRAMGIPLEAGREFSSDDTADRPPVIMINKSLARQLFPNGNAVGQLVKALGPFKQPVRIVGVVADVTQSRLDEAPAMQMYVPRSQQSAAAELIVRSTLAPEAVVSTVRATLQITDPTLIATDFRPIESLVDRAVSPRRFLVTLLGSFSLLALTLACLGIYGVISYAVNQRVQEIGVRMALGATAGEVARQVIGSTLRLAVLGIAIGLALSFLLVRLMAGLLFNTSPTDPATFVTTALVLGVVAVLAGAIPAIRAIRIDPMSALRAD